jgi:hypothetical protein
MFRTIRPRLEALEDRQLPATLLGGIVAPVSAGAVQPDWFQTNLNDPGLRALADADYTRDGTITRSDMLGLFAQAESTGVVSSDQFHDLQALVAGAQAGYISMPDDVMHLAANVVDGNIDNHRYNYIQVPAQNTFVVSGTTGTTAGALTPGFHSIVLGNLHAGSAAWQLQDLVNKWFLGMDLPRASSTMWGFDSAASLFGNGISYTDVAGGQAQDSYLLAGLAEIAAEGPQVITDNFIDNGDGTYTVRFYNTDTSGTTTTTYVTVNRWLPEDSSGHFIYAGQGQSLSDPSVKLWVALWEKAYAEANGANQWSAGVGTFNTYAALTYPGLPLPWDGFTTAFAVGHLTGKVSVTYILNPSTDQGDFTLLVKHQRLVGLHTGDLGAPIVAKDGYFVASHQSYAVVGYDPTTSEFTLYNPWPLRDQRASRVLQLSWQQISDIFNTWGAGSYQGAPVWTP